MRDDLERVSIVLAKEQHRRFREFSRKCHGSLSQFLRMAGENEIQDNNEADMINLRPIIQKLEKNDDMMTQLDARLQRTERATEYLVNKLGNKVEMVACAIKELLIRKGKLSIPEMKNYLPFTQEEIITGIEYLQETFIVLRIERLNAPSKWKINGDKNE